MAATPNGSSSSPLIAEERIRADLLRVLRRQVHAGRYRAEPEQVAEQIVAWFVERPSAA